MDASKKIFVVTGILVFDFEFFIGVRCTKSVSTAKTKTCESSKTPLTPQLTPKSQKQGKIDTSELPPDLAEIVAVWPELPGHIKAAIKALVQTHTKESE